MSAAQLAFFHPYNTGASPPLQMFPGGGGPLPGSGCCDGSNKAVDPRFGPAACPCDSTINSPHRSSHLHEAVTPKEACSPPAASLSPESASLYPVAMALPHGLPQGLPESYKCLPTQLGWNGYDPMMSPYMYHPYNINGFDPNSAVRRKNATRETTSALKAWLYEHRKNPYPTKAEKIMLAIITRMTLTQVSTWFANARRRLKKENKFWNSNDKDSFLPDDDKEDENESFDSDTKDVSTARVISSLEKENGRMRKLSGSCSDESYPETSDISDAEYNDEDENEKLIIVDDNVHDSDFSFSSSILSSKSFSEEPKHHSSPNHHSSPHHHSSQNHNNVSCSQQTKNTVSHKKLNSDSASHQNHSASSSSSSSRNVSSAPKPKIWSIANIIGDDNKSTPDTDCPSTSGSSSS